jgi:hypothetical protein
MSLKKRIGTTVASVLLLAAVGATLPAPAQAFPRGHRGPIFFGARGFYGYGPYFGYGYGPYFGAYGYGPAGGVDLNVAMMTGYGGVDMDVKPGQAEVWVDGKFRAEAKDLDGYPSYLWLKEGVHHVVVYKGGYQRFEEDIEVQRGFKKDLRIRLEKGDSAAPGRRPAGQI